MSRVKAVSVAGKSAGSTPRKQYHHGDLRDSLLKHGLQLLQEVGGEEISLRQLAERVGVSAPALYHHFQNKQELLYALGIQCVDRFEQALFEGIENSVNYPPALHDDPSSPRSSLEYIVLSYVRFAVENPELYELLFGRRMWKTGENSEFHRYARKSFRRLSAWLILTQQDRALHPDINPLRFAQVGWAALHGLCRMHNDGLAFRTETIEDIARYGCQLVERILFDEK